MRSSRILYRTLDDAEDAQADVAGGLPPPGPDKQGVSVFQLDPPTGDLVWAWPNPLDLGFSRFASEDSLAVSNSLLFLLGIGDRLYPKSPGQVSWVVPADLSKSRWDRLPSGRVTHSNLVSDEYWATCEHTSIEEGWDAIVVPEWYYERELLLEVRTPNPQLARSTRSELKLIFPGFWDGYPAARNHSDAHYSRLWRFLRRNIYEGHISKIAYPLGLVDVYDLEAIRLGFLDSAANPVFKDLWEP